MSSNSNNQNIENKDEGQVMAVEQSRALQVETQGTILSTGGLQEQTKPSDSQVVDLREDVDGNKQEDDYSSSVSDESFIFEVRDKLDVLHTPTTRALELAEKMIGGVHQSHRPSWHFEGRQGSTPGAGREGAAPVDHADNSPELAMSVGYYTTIRPCVEEELEASKALNLFGQWGKSLKDLRHCILRACFRELSIPSGEVQWERLMKNQQQW